MNTASKGRRNEHRSMATYIAQGFTCIRAAGSRGAWDFAAFSAHNVVLVQVRSSRWPGPAERKALANFPAAPFVIRELHRWRHRARKPDVLNWNGRAWVARVTP